MRETKNFWLLFLLTGSCIFLGSSSLSRSSSQEAVRLQKPLQHEVAVTLKLIQVYVTDKNGKPAANLDKSAFLVYDNGQLQAITEFETHMVPALGPGVTELPVKEAHVPTEIAAPRMSRKFFILIDLESNDLEGVAKSRAAAFHFLDSQALPSDEVGIFSYSFIHGLVLHINLTTDHGKVREAIQRIRDVPGKNSGGFAGADTGVIKHIPVSKRGETEGTDSGTIVTNGGDSAYVGSGVQASVSPSRAFADRMTALAKVLGSIPGYKNILYFSQGSIINGRDGDAVRRLDDMSREFGSSNAPLYAVNTETPNPFSMGSIIKGGELLAFVAEKSGGKAYKEVGAIAHFVDIARDIQDLTRNYYVLGYPVPQAWDGKYHKIKVEMRSGDFRIQAQAGYYNSKPFRDYSDFEKEIHLFDLALSEKPATQTPLIFSMKALYFENRDGARVLMLSKIPPEVIEKFSNKKIEFVSLMFDEQDNPADRKQMKPDLAKFRGMDVFYSSEATLKPGAYRCRFIIRDLDSGEAALAYARAAVPEKTESGFGLYSPLLLISGGSFATWDLGTKKNTAPWMDFYSYDRDKFSPVIEIPSGTARLFAVVPFRISKSSQPDIRWTAYLIDSTFGWKLPLAPSVLNKTRQGAFASEFLEFPANDIPRGKYTLYLHAEDTTTQSVSYAQTALVIR